MTHFTASDETEHYDVVVVGGAAAGLSGAKILARSRRSVLVIDAGEPRNAPADGVHNYLYAEGTAPERLRAIGRAEASSYGVDVLDGAATSAALLPDPAPGAPRFRVEVGTHGGDLRTVSARRLLVATGLVDGGRGHPHGPARRGRRDRHRRRPIPADRAGWSNAAMRDAVIALGRCSGGAA